MLVTECVWRKSLCRRVKMCKVQMLRALVKQRLTAAAEEIFGLFERTIAEYEEELSRSKEENERQRKLLDAVFSPQLRLHRAVVPSDVQKVAAVKEEKQEWSSSVDQEEPEPPHIKEEQEELCTSQEGEQLQGLEEADITAVPVKSEDDEEKAQSSQLHHRLTEQMETEADGEDCGGPEPARNSHPHTHLQPDTHDSADSDFWKETRKRLTGLNLLKNNEISDSFMGCDSGNKALSCSDVSPSECPEPETDDRDDSNFCKESSGCLTGLNCLKHNEVSQSDETFNNNHLLKIHKRNHTGEEEFTERGTVSQHMEVHTGEQEGIKQEEPEPPHIKEEQEELCTSQEGEQLQGLEEADITAVPVKSEDDEEKAQSSQLHHRLTEQMETGADGEDCGGPEPARNSHTHTHLQPVSEDKTSDYSDPETDDSADWKETREPQSGSNSVKNDDVSDSRCSDGEKPFSCSECEKRYGTRGNLKRHKRSHTGEKPFSCSECGKRFGLKASLKRHMQSHKQEKPFSCSVCKKSFTQSDSLRKHMRIHTGEKPFSCSECGKRFGKSGNLKRHMRTHTGEKPFSCSVCKKSFTQSGVLHLHMRIHTGEKPFSCSVCGKGFPDRGNLTRHLKTHAEEKPFNCTVCGKGYIEGKNLKVHMRTHTGEKPFSCTMCGKGFTEGRNLKVHMRTHTGEKPFSCSICKKSFRQSGALQLHVRIHTGEKPFSCSVCGKGFPERGYLKRHLRTHTEEKPFNCTMCGKGFAESRNLKIHMRTHTGEKPFSCSVCGKGFTDSKQMKMHMKTHTGEKPYSCSVCGKAFIENRNLKRHLRTHTGEKPFSCSVCGKAFTDSRQMKIHIKSHAGEKPYSCSICSKKFVFHIHHIRHMRTHTGEKRFSCSICDKRFSWLYQLTNHQCGGRQSSQLHQTQTEENREAEPPANSSAEQMEKEAAGEDCGGPEPARNLDPDTHSQPDTDDKTRDSS